MKKNLCLLLFATVVTFNFSCSLKDETVELHNQKSTMEVPLMVTNFENSGVNFKNTLIQVTKSSNAITNVYEIKAENPDENLEIISLVIITKDESGGYIVDHLTDDYKRIASLSYNKDNELTSIDVDDLPAKGWYGCTKFQYNEQKKRMGDSMEAEVLCEWFFCNTFRAIASGLYCIGLN